MQGQYSEQIIARAERDEEFRARLKDNPKAAIAEELGVEVPDSLSIRVIEESPEEAILVLPAAVAPATLRDEELAAIAGGSHPWCGSGPIDSGCGCHAG